MNFQAIKEAALQIKDKLTKPPLTDILIEATSNENWNTPTKLFQEISEASYQFTQCDTIMKFIWKRLDSDNREWRRIMKTLNMIDYLTKNGAPRCVGEFRDCIFKIRSFSDFIMVEQGSDKGLSIREKSKQLVDLLCNEKLIEEEREKAKKIRERLAAAGGIGAIGSNTNYQGYGRDTFKNEFNKGYGNDYSKNETNQNNLNEQNNTTKSDYQAYQQKYGIWDASGLDKYKKSETNNNKNSSIQENNNNNHSIQWTVPQTQSEILQAPFQEPVNKLIKPGEKWDVPGPKQISQQSQQLQQQKQSTEQQIQPQKQNIFDIFDSGNQQNLAQNQQTQHNQSLQTAAPQKSFDNDWGSFENVKTQDFPLQQAQFPLYLPTDIFNQQIQQQTVQQTQMNQITQQLKQTQEQQIQQPQQLYQQQHEQFYQQFQNQVGNQNTNQLSYQSSLQTNYNQQQQNNMNNQQYNFQINQQQQQNYNQQNVQQKKQEDFVFGDFISGSEQKQKNNNPIDLLGMLDLKKEKEELEIQKQIPIGNHQVQYNQLQTSQADIDAFKINYQNKQQAFSYYQYPQGR
ncbi:unnamed protein product [Paramecium sonneborni]|uniref:ENTH domain-containing protein n=1 Tax=Paramecium sonneborni TaxID=65129 RepID=A0A8S1MUV2_9CILI|nr:unnamed protein product [Paramecium sonneborni]